MVKRNLTRSCKNDMKKMKFDLEKEKSTQPSETTQGDVPSDTSANAKAILVDTSPMEEQSTTVDVPSITAVNTKAKVADTSPIEEKPTLSQSESVKDTAVDTKAKVVDTSPIEEQPTLGRSEPVEGPPTTNPDNVCNLLTKNSTKQFYLLRNVRIELCTFRGEEQHSTERCQRPSNKNRHSLNSTKI